MWFGVSTGLPGPFRVGVGGHIPTGGGGKPDPWKHREVLWVVFVILVMVGIGAWPDHSNDPAHVHAREVAEAKANLVAVTHTGEHLTKDLCDKRRATDDANSLFVEDMATEHVPRHLRPNVRWECQSIHGDPIFVTRRGHAIRPVTTVTSASEFTADDCDKNADADEYEAASLAEDIRREHVPQHVRAAVSYECIFRGKFYFVTNHGHVIAPRKD